MDESWRIDIAGLGIRLHDVHLILAELQDTYHLFQARGDAFKADDCNPHLCKAGCSHCCKKGAVFTVTLAEAVQWSLAVQALPEPLRRRSSDDASRLLRQQRQAFDQVDGPEDRPGSRDEALLSSRVTRLNAMGPACPLLADDLCSVYQSRPMLCRAYGFPVDAYSVEGAGTKVFRSLCVLYEGQKLADYVRAKDLRGRLAELSCRLGGGRDWGRFTSPEVILSHVGRIPFESADGRAMALGGETTHG